MSGGTGHPIGTGWKKPRTEYESGPTKGTGSQSESIKSNVGSEKRGSSLISECGEGHDKQPMGHGIGTGQKEANIRGMPRGGDSQIFGKVGMKSPDIFRQAKQTRDGPLRLSGVAGAHRIGKK
jgi:hypothetical protein